MTLVFLVYVLAASVAGSVHLAGGWSWKLCACIPVFARRSSPGLSRPAFKENVE
jgi:hypothetical protein